MIDEITLGLVVVLVLAHWPTMKQRIRAYRVNRRNRAIRK